MEEYSCGTVSDDIRFIVVSETRVSVRHKIAFCMFAVFNVETSLIRKRKTRFDD